MVNKKLGKRLMAVFLSAALLVPAPMVSAAGLPGTGQLEELSGENQPVGERLKDISQEEGAAGDQEDIREDALRDAPAGSREGVPDNSREGTEGGDATEGGESGGIPEGGESGGTPEGGDEGSTEAQEFVVDEKGILTAYNGAGGELTIPAEVGGVAVTGIAEKVFDEKKQELTKVTILANIKEIGDYLFKGCANLEEVVFPDSLEKLGYESFSGCGKLAKVEFNENLKEIGYYAFQECISLKSIHFPLQTELVREGAFRLCTALESITFEDGKNSQQCSLVRTAFEGCTSLTSVTFSAERYVSVDGNTFEGCTSLTEFKLAGESKYSCIYDGCLYKDTIISFEQGPRKDLVACPAGKTEIEFLEGVGAIGPYAFVGNSKLTSMEIPDTVTEISWYAFAGCTGLKKVVLPPNLGGISDHLFYGAALTEIEIPKTVKGIASDAFHGCKELKTVTIPGNVETVGEHSFEDCTGLESVYMQEGVKSIYSQAFKGCSSLKTWVIPESVTLIDYDAIWSEDTENLTIYGKKGSKAEDFAESNNINFSTELPPQPSQPPSTGEPGEEINDISNAAFIVTLEPAVYDYDGKEKSPAVTVKKGEQELRLGTDFTVDYENNINPGTAKAIVTGRKLYTGTVTKEFTIKGIDISNSGFAVTLSETEYTYDGKAKEPAVTVTKGTEKLTGADFTVKYENNVNPGTAKAIVTGTGIYTGSVTKEFTIKRSDISGAGFTVTLSQTSYTYDGKAKKPAVTVTKGTEKLRGTDFTVKYENNIKPGTAKAIVTGAGGYTGTVTKEFTIKEAKKKNIGLTCKKVFTKKYGDKAFSLQAKAVKGAKITYKTSDKKVAVVDKKGKVTIKGTGIATITVKATASGYNAKTLKVTVKVSPSKASAPSLKTFRGRKLKVSWKRDGRATGYQVQYCTSKAFKKGVKTITISKNKTVTKTIPKLTKGKRYYVRVRAYKSVKVNKKTQKLYGAWSSVKRSGKILR